MRGALRPLTFEQMKVHRHRNIEIWNPDLSTLVAQPDEWAEPVCLQSKQVR
jgi:hypothetical protein